MSKDRQPDEMALATAEEVLRRIYGDDLTGCKVSLQEIGRIIHEGAEPRGITELLELYEKLVEAIHLLSTAPTKEAVTEAAQLQELLTQRLDAIHQLTTKTLQTTAVFKKASGKE